MKVTPDNSLLQINNPVDNPPYNNWSVNQPSPAHDVGLDGREDLGLRDLTIDGINGFGLVQTRSQMTNPVDNPPYNNWSVNQPSPAHDVGLRGREDLGMRGITIDGINGYGFAQTDAEINNPVDNPPYNNWSVNQPSPPHDVGMAGSENLGVTMIVRGHKISVAEEPSPTHEGGMKGDEDLGMDMTVSRDRVHVSQKH